MYVWGTILSQLTIMNIKILIMSLQPFFCLIQGIYKNFDADSSGMIGSDELPGAFKAAGE